MSTLTTFGLTRRQARCYGDDRVLTRAALFKTAGKEPGRYIAGKMPALPAL